MLSNVLVLLMFAVGVSIGDPNSPCLAPICTLFRHCSVELPPCAQFLSKGGVGVTSLAGLIHMSENHVEVRPTQAGVLGIQDFLTANSCAFNIVFLSEIDSAAGSDCDYARSNASLKTYNEKQSGESFDPDIIGESLQSGIIVESFKVQDIDGWESHRVTEFREPDLEMRKSLENMRHDMARVEESQKWREEYENMMKQSGAMPNSFGRMRSTEEVTPKNERSIVDTEEVTYEYNRFVWRHILTRLALLSVFIASIVQLRRACRKKKLEEQPPKYQQFV